MLPVFLAALLQSVSLVTDIAPATSRLPTRVLLVVPTSNALPTPMSTTRAEVGRIWRAAGVELTWLSRLPRGELSFDRVIAVVVDDAAFAGSALPVGALGGVPMVAGRMRQIVYLSPTAIKQLVAQAGVLPTGGQFGGAYARMVGRVIAHELGHLLLYSSAHRESGLMRPSFVARDVMSPNRDRFTLGGDDVQVVQQRVAETRRLGERPGPVEALIARDR